MSNHYYTAVLHEERRLRSACIGALHGRYAYQLDEVSRARLALRIAHAEDLIVRLETRLLKTSG